MIASLGMMGQVSVEREIVASGGTEFEGVSLQLSYTIGEVMVSSHLGGAEQFTQGYQQYFVDASTTCLGDFNEDGEIDTLDLLIMLANFSCTSMCVVDMNGDDMTDTIDLLSFLSVYGTSCVP
jgi:hypothetical protein